MKYAPLLASVIFLGIIALVSLLAALSSAVSQPPTFSQRQDIAYQARQDALAAAQIVESNARADAIRTEANARADAIRIEANANAQATRVTTWGGVAAFIAVSVMVTGFLRKKPVERIIERQMIYSDRSPRTRPAKRQVVYLDKPRQEVWEMAERVGQKVLKGGL